MTGDLRTELLEDIKQNPGISGPELKALHSDCDESVVKHTLARMYKRRFILREVDRTHAKGRGCWRYWLEDA